MVANHRAFYVSRRRVIRAGGLAGFGLLAACGQPGQAPQPSRLYRIGRLGDGPRESQSPPPPGVVPVIDAFRQGLAEHGWVEEQNLAIEWRSTDGGEERLLALATQLVHLPVDLIATHATPATQAAKRATSTIPIVFSGVADPVALGFVSSLARPGGNLTGLSDVGRELGAKRLELLRDTIPSLARVGVFWQPTNPGNVAQLRETEMAARVLGLHLELFGVEDQQDIDLAFGVAASERVDALLVLGSPPANIHRARLIELVAGSGLPAMYPSAEFVQGGGLMGYGPSQPALTRRAAAYVDKILKGAKPADLPVEQPREFDFMINLRTAQALGLTIPQHLLVQATEVVQ